MQIVPYSATTSAAPGQLKADAEALPGIRLMDPAMIGPTFEQLQQVRGYYAFPDDRSTSTATRSTASRARRRGRGPRDEPGNGLPDQNWNNIHTVYTHGYGLVVAYGNRRQTRASRSGSSGTSRPSAL